MVKSILSTFVLCMVVAILHAQPQQLITPPSLEDFVKKPGIAFPGVPKPGFNLPIASGNNPWLADQQARSKQQAMFQEMLREFESGNRTVNYTFPSQRHKEGAEAYHKASKAIRNMLDGKEALNVKKATFLVENAYYNNQGTLEDFSSGIDELVQTAKQLIAQNGWDVTHPTTPLLAIQSLMTDTLFIEQPGSEELKIHYPFTYDFENYRGEKDRSKLFVSKLMATGTGQCYSMPTLFLILAEELGTKAHLAFSPNHSYIRFQDGEGNWHNLELTNGNLVSDAWVTGSGFVKAEAISSGLYMDTLSAKQLIAQKLADLAQGYIHKFGYDEFVQENVDQTLIHHPENAPALAIKSNYYTQLTNYIWWQKGRPEPEQFTQDLRAADILRLRNQMYQHIDQLGYSEMPEEIYQDWLNMIKTKQQEQAHQQQFIQLEQTIKRGN